MSGFKVHVHRMYVSASLNATEKLTLICHIASTSQKNSDNLHYIMCTIWCFKGAMHI